MATLKFAATGTIRFLRSTIIGNVVGVKRNLKNESSNMEKLKVF